MFTAHRHRRSAVLCAAACTALMALTCSAAVAAPTWQERYYQSHESTPAEAQGAYYSSYGEPEPIAPAPSPASGDSTPVPAIVVSLALVALIAGAGATQVHRIRLRRRTAHPAL